MTEWFYVTGKPIWGGDIVNQITVTGIFSCAMFLKWSCFNLCFKYLNRASIHFSETEIIHQTRRKQLQYIGHNLLKSISDKILWRRKNYTNWPWFLFLINKPCVLFILPSLLLAFNVTVFNKHIFSGAFSITEWLSSDSHINYPPL